MTKYLSAKVYDRAAEILDERGLNKGNYQDPTTGAVCYYGAIYSALAESRRMKTAFEISQYGYLKPRSSLQFTEDYGVLGEVFDHWEPTTYNDAKSRRKRDVVGKLRKMAAVTRGEK